MNNVATIHSAFIFLLQSIKTNLQIIIQNLAAPQSAFSLMKQSSVLFPTWTAIDENLKTSRAATYLKSVIPNSLLGDRPGKPLFPQVFMPPHGSNFSSRCGNGGISSVKVCFYVSRLMVLPLLRTGSLWLCLQVMSMTLEHWTCWLSFRNWTLLKMETPGGFGFFMYFYTWIEQ